jgi:hypothetical protein
MDRLRQISRSVPVMALLVAMLLVAILAYVAYVRDDVSDDGWQTYRDRHFGYELRYPPGWQLVSEWNARETNGVEFQTLVFGREPAPPSRPNQVPVPNVTVSVNFQGDLCGGPGSQPIEVGGVAGSETTCYFDVGGLGCTPMPQCMEKPLTIVRRFETKGRKYYVWANNGYVTITMQGTPISTPQADDPEAAQTAATLRKIVESYRFVD